MLLAAEPALQGVRPIVLERLAAPTGESKAGTLHARTAQSLDRRGLLDLVGHSTFGRLSFHVSGMFGLDLGAVAHDGPSIVGSPQAWAEQVFARRATALGADIRRGQEVTGLVQYDDHVVLTVNGADRLDVVRAKTDHEAEAVLVRPDGYVAWVPGVTGHPLRESLERWLGTGGD
jgi:flavin-dependent dehydrogenase